MTEYEVQANEFLKKACTKMSISRVGEVNGFPFDDHDSLWHYKYQVTLTRNKKQYRFTFYDSHYNWQNNKRPSRYDVLACVEKYDPGCFEWFIKEYGYDRAEFGYEYGMENKKEEKRIKKIYEACKNQYERLLDLFGEDLMEDLRDIN